MTPDVAAQPARRARSRRANHPATHSDLAHPGLAPAAHPGLAPAAHPELSPSAHPGLAPAAHLGLAPGGSQHSLPDHPPAGDTLPISQPSTPTPLPTITPDGTRRWLLEGTLHRDDGPALIYRNGTSLWFRHGLLHRVDGPALEYASGPAEWWLHGERLTEAAGRAVQAVTLRTGLPSHVLLRAARDLQHLRPGEQEQMLLDGFAV